MMIEKEKIKRIFGWYELSQQCLKNKENVKFIFSKANNINIVNNNTIEFSLNGNTQVTISSEELKFYNHYGMIKILKKDDNLEVYYLYTYTDTEYSITTRKEQRYVFSIPKCKLLSLNVKYDNKECKEIFITLV